MLNLNPFVIRDDVFIHMIVSDAASDQYFVILDDTTKQRGGG